MIDKCPHCGSSWVGEPIPEKDRHLFDGTHFLRQMGIEDGSYDGISWWRCPDCEKVMCRWCLVEQADPTPHKLGCRARAR